MARLSSSPDDEYIFTPTPEEAGTMRRDIVDTMTTLSDDDQYFSMTRSFSALLQIIILIAGS